MRDEKPIELLIWGCGYTYLHRRQYLEYEMQKKNIICNAIYSKDCFAKTVDGIPLICKQDISKIKFDFILVFCDEQFEEISTEIIELGYERKKILDSKILEIYGFDFKRYSKLIFNPITIISQDCTAANIYSYLKLKFTSPFILTAFDETDYMRFITRYDYYIKEELKFKQESNIYREQFGIGYFGNVIEEEVPVKLYHYKSFDEAKMAWDRRKKRINNDNKIIMCRINSEERLEQFENINFNGRKFAIVTDPSMANNITTFYLPRYTWRIKNKCDLYGYTLGDYMRNMEWMSYSIDILKLLVGDKDFQREY